MEKFLSLFNQNGLILTRTYKGETIRFHEEVTKIEQLWRLPREDEDMLSYVVMILDHHTVRISDKTKFLEAFTVDEMYKKLAPPFYETICLLPDEEGSLCFDNYEVDEGGYWNRLEKDIANNIEWYEQTYPDFKLRRLFDFEKSKKYLIEDQMRLRINFMNNQPGLQEREELFKELFEALTEHFTIQSTQT